MRDFEGKVAVITGAASGIGLGLAQRAAREGIRVVLADVSQAAEIEALADKAFDRFGGVHLLCNNAAVGSPGRTVWGQTIADWEWVLGVNRWT